jgi:hypothetical protein
VPNVEGLKPYIPSPFDSPWPVKGKIYFKECWRRKFCLEETLTHCSQFASLQKRAYVSIFLSCIWITHNNRMFHVIVVIFCGSAIMNIRMTCPFSGYNSLESADTLRLSRNAINDSDSNTVQYAQTSMQQIFCVYVSLSYFRSKILQLIFITYLDPQVSFQADSCRGHATVWALIKSVCDKRSISILTQHENC